MTVKQHTDERLFEMTRCISWVKQQTGPGRVSVELANSSVMHVWKECDGLCKEFGLEKADLVDLETRVRGVWVDQPALWERVAPPWMLVAEVMES